MKTSWKHFAAWVNGEAESPARFDMDYTPPDPDEIRRKRLMRRRKRADHPGGIQLREVLLYRLSTVLATVGLIGILLATVVALPPYGAPDTPDQNEVCQRYVEQGAQETGAVNLVTGMILDYRAFDTFGESCVLFLSAVSTIMLLRKDRHSYPARLAAELEEDDVIEGESDKQILQLMARLLTPMIFLFGFYVILNGHLTPGGGFSGGAIMGGGLILYSTAYGHDMTHRFFTYRSYTVLNLTCLCIYAALKGYSFFTGANHLESHIPIGTPGNIFSAGLILPLNICVGIVVACTMYAFYALFDKGDL